MGEIEIIYVGFLGDIMVWRMFGGGLAPYFLRSWVVLGGEGLFLLTGGGVIWESSGSGG